MAGCTTEWEYMSIDSGPAPSASSKETPPVCPHSLSWCVRLGCSGISPEKEKFMLLLKWVDDSSCDFSSVTPQASHI